MDLNINVLETVRGDIAVKETAYDDGFYSDDVVGFDESASVSILLDKSFSTIGAYIHNHGNTNVVNKFSIDSDGFYIVNHFVIPTMDWWNRRYGDGTLSNWYPIFVTDGVTLYQYEEGNFQETTPEAVYSASTTSSHNPSVWATNKNVFAIYNLWQCYLNYCRKMLEEECSKDSICLDCDSELFKNMKLLWIFLNAIWYYVKFGEFYKAQEFLDKITNGCNTLCHNEIFSKDYNCGCS